MNFEYRDEVLVDILKRSFPQAKNMNIVEKIVENPDQYFTSKIVQLKIEYEEDGDFRNNSVVLKIPYFSRTYEYFDGLHLYEKETLMYEQMLGKMNALLDKNLGPVHYYTHNSQILVLENLKTEGYVCVAKSELLGLTEANQILKCLAQFHAASRKIREQNPHSLDDPIFDTTIQIAMRKCGVDTWTPILTYLARAKKDENLATNFQAAMTYLERKGDDECHSMINKDKFEFVVLNHGDIRKDNILLKYDSNGSLQNIKMVDFQGSCWSTPTLDVMYFLITSVKIEAIENNFETLVDHYLRCLNDQMRKLNCWRPYGEAEFMADLKRINFHHCISLLFLAGTTGNIDHSKVEDIFLLDKKENTHIYEQCSNDEYFAQTVFGWMKFLDKLGVFDNEEH